MRLPSISFVLVSTIVSVPTPLTAIPLGLKAKAAITIVSRVSISATELSEHLTERGLLNVV